MIGLVNKGHLSPGADADLTVIDPVAGKATMAIVAGEQIMIDGKVVGTGGKLLVTESGERAASESGLPFEIVDLTGSKLYAGFEG
jgi:N-acyl-D-aspartate/D-glutamate deacylase